MTGRCVSSRSTGTAVRSSVLRVDGSNVRMPRSQRITLALPADSTYSAAISHSSMVAPKPRLSSTGVRALAGRAQQREVVHVAAADLDACRRIPRRPPLGWHRSSRTRSAGPSPRAPRRAASRPSSPRPWNAYGDVRGLYAPPRSTCAPSRLTSRAVATSCSRDSTAQGPAMIAQRAPAPMGTLPHDRDPRPVAAGARRLASLCGLVTRMACSTPGMVPMWLDAVDVDADDADHRALLLLADEGLQPFRPNERADGLDLRLLRVRPHYDDHLRAPFE